MYRTPAVGFEGPDFLNAAARVETDLGPQALNDWLHALEDAGIPAFIRGEALLGGLGELGVFGLVAVCVPSGCWPEARAVSSSNRSFVRRG